MATAYAEIPLHGQIAAGRVALIDIDDYELVSRHRWWVAAGKYPYAVTDIQGRRVYMHGLITGFRKTDHEDLDELNNQRSNLRDGTDGRNEQHQRAQRGRSSKYKGVWRHSQNPAWIACITIAGRRRHLGSFRDEEDAARAYDAAAKEHFGEYALLNFQS